MSWLIKKMIKALAIVYVLCFAQICWAGMGLETNPGEIDVTGVPLGRKVAVSKLTEQPVYLEIKNKSDAGYDYVISILHTAQTTSPLRQGFIDIPDTSWIMPEEKEVRIEAGQTKQVELYINIPNKKAYAGKKYQAVIEVKNKKNAPQDLFVLACQLRITLQTKMGKGGRL